MTALERVVDRLLDRATGRNVAWSWGAFFAFSLIVFPLFDVVNGMPAEPKALDIQFFHPPERVYETLDALGAEGRVAYLRSLLIADVVWPLIYGTTLALSIAWGFEGHEHRRRLIALPLLAVITDFLENTLIAIQIGLFPDSPGWLAHVSSRTSSGKWVFAGAATIVGLVALLRRVRRR